MCRYWAKKAHILPQLQKNLDLKRLLFSFMFSRASLMGNSSLIFDPAHPKFTQDSTKKESHVSWLLPFGRNLSNLFSPFFRAGKVANKRIDLIDLHTIHCLSMPQEMNGPLSANLPNVFNRQDIFVNFNATNSSQHRPDHIVIKNCSFKKEP
jgi:hypothetical protein